MKAILEFELPEDESRHRIATDSYKWIMVIKDIAHHIRQQLKHGELTREAEEALQTVRDLLYENIQDYGLNEEDIF